jgi:hypothetical protein
VEDKNNASGLDKYSLCEYLARPNWTAANAEWEAYVPGDLEELWDGLSFETKVAVYLTA